MTTRLAVVDESKCKPSKCGLECRKKCPVVFMGKECIDVSKTSKIAFISEQLCNGCNNCAKTCPFGAVTIVRLPGAIGTQVHRYGPNMFALNGLPVMKPGIVMGMVGANGVGKSTAMKILAGKLVPNLGTFRPGTTPGSGTTADIIRMYRGSEMHTYLTRLYASTDPLTVSIKTQYVDRISASLTGTVADHLLSGAPESHRTAVIAALSLETLVDKNIRTLSGGELQRFAIARAASKKADVYMFDELTSFLDVKQRICAAKLVRTLRGESTYVVAIEHDLSILDYLSDQVCCQYGVPGAYGTMSQPISTRDGVNQFIDGYLPGENMRFRPDTLNFHQSTISAVDSPPCPSHRYDAFELSLPLPLPLPSLDPERKSTATTDPAFHLSADAGSFSGGTVTVILGENGTGKTTFIKRLASSGLFSVSCKPQLIRAAYKGTVRAMLLAKIKAAMADPVFQSTVAGPLKLASLYDTNVQALSGGEIQTVAICLALGKPADVYLIDEPSAYLDSEQRIAVSRAIKSFVVQTGKAAFVVEHDMLMATTIANQVIVFQGTPAVRATASAPMSMTDGMNLFLRSIGTTLRTDPTSGRPRINKHGSNLDKEQHASGKFYG